MVVGGSFAIVSVRCVCGNSRRTVLIFINMLVFVWVLDGWHLCMQSRFEFGRVV